MVKIGHRERKKSAFGISVFPLKREKKYVHIYTHKDYDYYAKMSVWMHECVHACTNPHIQINRYDSC
jgi:hypothetical protein